MIFPIKSLEAIKKARENQELSREFFDRKEETPIFLFTPETYGKSNQFNCRMFADAFGIPEDPATGSANGCLAGYLLKHKFLRGNKIEVRVEQGYEIGRKSLLHLNASIQSDLIEVNVGGQVFEIAEGWLK
jgi:trans-2,3-dihydro-3-hydroxyanthranilate isomerase